MQSILHVIHSKLCIILRQISFYVYWIAYNRPELVAQQMVSKMIQVRLQKRLSVNKLAWMSGVSPSAIAFLENGTHSPTLKTFLRIATALELDMARLYWEADQEIPATE